MATTKRTTKKPATKKKVAKAAAVKAPSKGRKLRNNENPHPRRLKGALLYEIRSTALAMQLATEKLTNVNTALDALSMSPQHAPVFALLSKKATITEDAKEAKLAFIEAQKKLAAKFNIPIDRIHEYTFDTETGTMSPSKLT